ncbi:MAG: DUF4175 family protein [Candidatus Brocadiales bacterium]
MDEASTTIERTIKAVRKRVIAICLCEGGALVGAFFFLLLLAGALLGGLFSYLPGTRIAFQIISLTALSYIIVKAVLIPLFPLFRDEKIALLIEKANPLNDSVITSVQLIKDSTSPERANLFSKKIVSLQIADTVERLRKVDPASVAPKTLLRRNFYALIASASLFGIFIVFCPAYSSRSLAVLFNIQPAEVVTHEIEEQVAPVIPIIIGDITLSYRYPLYTGLKPKTIASSSGDIKALKGSEVTITATCNQPLSSANIVVNETSVIPLKIEKEKTVNGTLTLLEGGEYAFEVIPSDGKKTIDPVRHRIIIEDDNYPEIAINYPKKDLEVNEKDIVTLRYNARDDFGLNTITLVVEHKDRKERKALDTIRQRKLHFSGSYKWSLSEVKLSSGEKLPYYLEATDNDTISGPKVSRSETRYLYIHSAEKKHKELIKLQEALLKEMVQLLGDDLVKPISANYNKHIDNLLLAQEAIFDRTDHVLNIFAEVLDGMRDDSLANYSIYFVLENMRDKIRELSLKRRTSIKHLLPDETRILINKKVLDTLQSYQDEEVVELENDVLLLDELIRKQKLEEIFNASKELTNYQDSISSLLEELEKGYQPETMEKVLNELKAIEKLTRQMLEKVARLSNEIPDEFLNEDALKGIEQEDIASYLKKMKDALRKGDLESALEAARRLVASMQQMMSIMQDAATQYADSAYSDMLNEIDKLEEQVSELEMQEQELASNTDKLKKDVQERIYGKMDEMLKEFFETQQERLKDIQKDVNAVKETLSKDPNLQDLFGKSYGSESSVRDLREFYDRLREMSRPYQGYDDTRRGEEYESRFVRKKDPFYRMFLSLARKLPKTEEALSQLDEMLEGWDTKESLDLAKETLAALKTWNADMRRKTEGMRPEKESHRLRKEPTEKDMSLKEEEEFAEKEPTEEQDVIDKMVSAEALNQQIVDDLESLMAAYKSGLKKSLTSAEKGVMDELAKKQGDIKTKTDYARKKLDKLLKQGPIIGKQTSDNLNQATESMGRAKSELDKQNVLKGLLGEREALYQLAEAKKGLQEAKERLQEGIMGGGMPFPMFGFRGRRIHEGQMGRSLEDVEIPSEEAYKVPKEFRQDIIDAMKEGLPEKYKKLNKDYYKRLVE